MKEEWSILGDWLMIRTSFKKQYKTPRTLILYIVLMLVTLGLLYLTVFRVFFEDKENLGMVYTDICLYILSITLCLGVAFKDPGYLKRDNSIDFLEML